MMHHEHDWRQTKRKKRYTVDTCTLCGEKRTLLKKSGKIIEQPFLFELEPVAPNLKRPRHY